MRNLDMMDAIQDFVTWIEDSNDSGKEVESWYDKDNGLHVWFKDGTEEHYFWFQLFYYLSERDQQTTNLQITEGIEK